MCTHKQGRTHKRRTAFKFRNTGLTTQPTSSSRRLSGSRRQSQTGAPHARRARRIQLVLARHERGEEQRVGACTLPRETCLRAQTNRQQRAWNDRSDERPVERGEELAHAGAERERSAHPPAKKGRRQGDTARVRETSRGGGRKGNPCRRTRKRKEGKAV